MSFSALGVRPLFIAASAALAIGLVPATANAGFFDQLFGGGAPSQPSYGYEPQQPSAPEFGTPILRPRARKKVVAHDAAPVRQKTTDLMSDKTLHPGDAVMMKDGMHIYSGGDSTRHTAKQFVPIDRSRSISSKTRAVLVALDTTRNDPLKTGKAVDTIASGRSAAVGAPISKGFKITDARGQSIRYVGP